MKLFCSSVAAAGLALAASSIAIAGSAPPALSARPSGAGRGLAAGETQLAGGAVAYRPPIASTGPLPLVVLLHGAGGYPPAFLQKMEPVADRIGVILLAPHSLGPTWDLVEKMAVGDDPWGGPDAHRIDRSLADLFTRTPVDSTRVTLLGFSDGASYALSLGLANPGLFTAVVALSPGMLAPPRRLNPAQRIFIAHGRSDRVLPFANASDIADGLRRDRGNVRFRPFEGGHQIDPGALSEALEWSLREPVLQP